MIQKKERKTASRALKALSQDDTDDLKKKKKSSGKSRFARHMYCNYR